MANKHKNSFDKQLKNKFGDSYQISSWEGYENRRSVVKFKCKLHGEYESIATNVLTSHLGNCKECYKDQKYKEFLTKAYKIHGTDYSYRREDYETSRMYMKIYCNKHEEYFEQRPSAHLQGQGCPLCHPEKVSATKRTNAIESFLERAKEKYGDKFKYNLDTYVCMKTSMKIVCPIHGKFEILPREHLTNGCGCQECNKVYRLQRLKESFISKAKEIYKGRSFNYDKVEYIKNTVPVKILCEDHNKYFQVTPNKMLDTSRNIAGCEDCKRLSLNRWALKSVKKIPDITNYEGYFYLGKISGVEGVKIGITKDLKSRQSCYERDLVDYGHAKFSFIESFSVGYYRAFVLESVLKSLLKTYQVKHNLDFGGKTEMFHITKPIFNLVDELVQGKYKDNIDEICNNLLDESSTAFKNLISELKEEYL